MSKQLVKYNNYFNSVPLKTFTATDYNILYAICAKMRDHGIQNVVFTMAEIRKMTGFSKNSNEELYAALEQVYKKIGQIFCKVETEKSLVYFTLFTAFTIDKEQQTLLVSVNEKFAFILNDLTKNFTQFELREFVELRSKYAKILYKQLKQFRTTGFYVVKAEELRTIMDVPEKISTKRFVERILTPAIETLKDEIPGLVCTPIYNTAKRGHPLDKLKFTFDKDEVAEISMEQENEMQEKLQEITKPEEESKPTGKNNSFSNFHQRSYDYDELERLLTQSQK